MIKKNHSKKIIDKLLNSSEVRREVATRKINVFFPVYFSHYLKYKTPGFHEEIFDILENEALRVFVLIAFRGSAKSSIITTAYVLWSILGVQQKKFIIINGRSEREAKQYLQNIKYELEHNALLKRDLGPFDEEKNSLGNATALVIRKLNAKIMISSSEQSIRGIRHGEHRPDLIILDDVEDLNSVRTQEGRNKLYDWVEGDIFPAGDEKTRIIMVGNLLHEDSLLKRIQKKMEVEKWKGIYREYPIIDEQGNPLWPGKYPTPQHIEEERKKFSNVAWAREFLLKIVANEDQLIKREWIKRYAELPPDYGYNYYAMGVDLAISLSSKADYTTIVSAQVFGYRKNLRVYILLNPVNARLTSYETIECIKAEARLLRHAKIYVEDVQYQGSIIEHLYRDNFKAIGVNVHQDKYSRLSAVSHLVESGKVLFPERPDKNIDLLLSQIINFGVEKHDDLADAFSLLLLQIIEKDNNYRPYPNLRTDGKDLQHLSARERDAEIQRRKDILESHRRLTTI